MPIDTSSMMLKLNPLSPINMGGLGQQSGMERERLRLAREQFDWEKKQAEENARLEREKSAAQLAKARLEAEATKAAKLQEDRLKAYGEFTKATGEGNVEGARAMVPMMHSLGMDIELEGEEGGLPRYRIDMDAAATEAQEAARVAQASPYGDAETAEQSLSRLGAMGLGGETGSLLPPLGIRSSDEVDPTTGASVADRVAATYGMPGEKTATAGPDTEDFTGGVPKNVIDMGASAAATLHRLDPALKGAVAAYPDAETRAGAEQIRQGLRGSGLPLAAQLKAFGDAVSGPASQRNTLIAADAQREKFRETRDELTEKDEAGLQQVGRDDADKFATDNHIYDVGKALRAGDTILDVIDKPGADDAMIASELMTFQNVKGTPSDTDLKLAFGIPFASTLDQALDTISKMVKGGMGPTQREAIKSYIATKGKELERGAFDYLDQAHARAAGGAYNERSKKAYLQTIKGSVPGHLYNDWLDMKKKRGDAPAASRGDKSAELSAPGSASASLASQAEAAGLNASHLGALMGGESGGDPNAANSRSSAKGVFQVIDSVAKGLGFKDAADYAAQPAEKQIESGLKLFKAKGLTANSPRADYALVLAAPSLVGKWKSLDEVVYKKGSEEWKINEPWRPKDQGDITIGSITDYYFGKGDAKPRNESPALRLQKERARKAALPPPKSALDQEVADILRKAGE
jgi:hypothetical protein